MHRTEKTLAIVLQASAVLLLLALLPAVMPFGWMVTINGWLGLDDLPPTPIVSYLTHSLSAMYAIHGALLLYLSFDVRRRLPVIRFLMALSILFGVYMTVLDCMVELPVWWIIGEGPFIIALAVVLLWLAARVDRRANHQ